MSATDDFLANNARYAESFPGQLPLPPSRQNLRSAQHGARPGLTGPRT